MPAGWKCLSETFCVHAGPTGEKSTRGGRRECSRWKPHLPIWRVPLRKLRAKVDFDPLPSVRVHAIQLQQVFQNLISNAIKYHRPGISPVVHITARRENESVVFSVIDNGIGIEPEFQERIFGLFKRLHTGSEYSGTGIGLALCQRIVERHDGRIWVESEPGTGSTFHFTFPGA